MTISRSIASPTARPLSSPLAGGGGGGLPSSSLLQQALLLSSGPTIDGLILGEEPGRGTQRAMQPGRCGDFDGVNDNIVVGNIGSVNTVSVWVKPDNITSHTDGLILLSDTIYSRIINGTVTLTGYSGGTNTIYVDGVASATIPSTGWHHVVIVSTTARSASAAKIGLASSYMDGKLFDVQVFSRALTSAEVSQLYTLGTDALPNEPRTAWWKLDEQHTTTALDSSSNGNHGTLMNVNATVGNFFYEGDDVPHSYQNDKGFTQRYNWVSKITAANADWAASRVTKINQAKGVRLEDNTTDVGTNKFRYVQAVGVNSLTYNSDGPSTISCLFKAAEFTYGVIGEGEGQRAYGFFDLSTGTVYGAGGVLYIAGSAACVHEGDGWYRCSIQVNLSGTTYLLTFSGASSAGQLSGYASTRTAEVGSGILVDEIQVASGPLRPYQNYAISSLMVNEPIPRDESDKTKDIFSNDLMYSGKCPRNAQLVQSNCLTLDGTDDYAILSSEVPVTSTDYTYYIRYYATADSKMTCGVAGDSNAYLIWLNGSSIYHKCNAAGTNYAYATVGPHLNRWVEVVLRRNGNGNAVTFFFDGIKYTSAYIGTLPNNKFAMNMIGTAASLYFKGSISGVSAWDRSLSDEECMSLFSSDGPADAVYRAPMAEGAGNLVYDTVGGRHGTLTNFDLAAAWATKQNVHHYNAALGYTKYTHATLSPLYVPFDVNGNPTVVTPPSGYTKVADYPAGAWHNLAESKLDLTQGVASPGSAGLPTALDPLPEPTNPLFRRLRTMAGVNVAADRIVRYSEVLTGDRLLGVQKFTETKEV